MGFCCLSRKYITFDPKSESIILRLFSSKSTSTSRPPPSPPPSPSRRYTASLNGTQLHQMYLCSPEYMERSQDPILSTKSNPSSFSPESIQPVTPATPYEKERGLPQSQAESPKIESTPRSLEKRHHRRLYQ